MQKATQLGRLFVFFHYWLLRANKKFEFLVCYNDEKNLINYFLFRFWQFFAIIFNYSNTFVNKSEFNLQKSHINKI